MAFNTAWRFISRRGLLAATTVALAVAFCIWAVDDRIERARLLRADPDAIAKEAPQSRFLGAGRRIFGANCASCHGQQGQGDAARGVPNLADQDWLYGDGSVGELEQTIAYGIRSLNPKGWNLASMPAFGRPDPKSPYKLGPLRPGEIRDVIAFLDSRRHAPVDPDAASRGAAIYSDKGGCFDCHGRDAAGDPAIGAPNLVDHTWLSGDGSHASVFASIYEGSHGISPAFVDRLSAAQIREVALYVHSLSQIGAASPKESR